MHPVEHAIWLVESRLGRDIGVAEVSREVGLSRFHIARVFADATGRTLSGYMRGRRLTEAARTLATGAPDVLSVALAAGYGSHEAFTRAFRSQFGTTPERVRRARDLTGLQLVEPIRMNAPQRIPLASPIVEVLPPAGYVGLSQTYPVTSLGGIPDQWQRFTPFLAGLDRREVGNAYGILRNASPNGETVIYTCAIRAGLGLEAGGELKAFSLPAMRIARFAHKGHISAIKATTGAIYAELAQLGLRAVGPCDMIECYGPEFDPETGFGTVGIWIHVADEASHSGNTNGRAS